ncbi:MAG: hypothetical protein M1826_007785 [Phylliscum demangeonii]|nr:MAG: hypothetical protein M1826_007785 [Phylliscum demangeonii]
MTTTAAAVRARIDDAADDYFAQNPAPADLGARLPRVVLLSSDGTTVRRERQTVRVIDNFSAGTRGATWAEYFLAAGPRRPLPAPPLRRVQARYRVWLPAVVRRDRAAQRQHRLCRLPFTTLWALRELATGMRPLGSRARCYRAAAVSDFFVPRHRLARHKIQCAAAAAHDDDDSHGPTTSAVGLPAPLVVNLDPVPKFLKRLVDGWAPDGWAPDGIIVSFKLETDPRLLVAKARQALQRIISSSAICWQRRKWEVVLVASG